MKALADDDAACCCCCFSREREGRGFDGGCSDSASDGGESSRLFGRSLAAREPWQSWRRLVRLLAHLLLELGELALRRVGRL